MNFRLVIIRLSYGYVAVIMRKGFDNESKTERKWNGNEAGKEREGGGNGAGRERKNEGQNNIFCAKTCKCQIFFVTLQAGRNWGNNRRNTAEN